MIGIAFSMLAGFGFACATICARLGLVKIKPSVGTSLTLISSFLVTAIVTVPLYSDTILSLKPISFFWFFLVGLVTFPMARFLNILSISIIGAPRSSAIISLDVFFAAVLAILFLGEEVNWAIGVGSSAIVIALILISQDSKHQSSIRHHISNKFILGILVALISALCYGSSSVLGKIAIDNYAPPLVVATFSLLFGALIMLLMSIKDMRSLNDVPISSCMYLLVSGIFSAVSVSSIYLALSYSKVVIVVPLIATFPVFTLILSRIFLRSIETISLSLIIGVLLITLGVILIISGRI